MSIAATEAAPNTTWRLEVESATPGTFTPVAGLNSFSPTPAYTTADNSDFNSGMWGSDLPTQMKMTIAATFIRRNTGSAYDGGQELLREAAYNADLVRVRYYDTAFPSAEAYEADAYVQWSPQGGGTTAIQTVNVTLNVQGKPATVANPGPTSSTGVPTITNVTPTGQTVGDQVRIDGNGYTGVTGVTIDGVTVAEYMVLDPNTIVAVIPTGVSGAAPVVVTNASGSSAPYAYTASGA